MTEVSFLIEEFDLQPHPEGGFFKETYRSKGKIAKSALPTVYSGERNYSTSIYFLLTSDTFSAFHKIHQDETWHFYGGSPLCLHMISPQGIYSSVVIGNNFKDGQVPQYVVSGGIWFATEVIPKDSYSFVGCTVSPGFDFEDFNLPSGNFLNEKFPEHQQIIEKFTRT